MMHLAPHVPKMAEQKTSIKALEPLIEVVPTRLLRGRVTQSNLLLTKIIM